MSHRLTQGDHWSRARTGAAAEAVGPVERLRQAAAQQAAAPLLGKRQVHAMAGRDEDGRRLPAVGRKADADQPVLVDHRPRLAGLQAVQSTCPQSSFFVTPMVGSPATTPRCAATPEWRG